MAVPSTSDAEAEFERPVITHARRPACVLSKTAPLKWLVWAWDTYSTSPLAKYSEIVIELSE